MDEAEEIWFGAKGDAAPLRKTFLSELKIESPPAPTIWTHNEAGHNHEARDEIKALLKADSFDTPKPTRLLERILQIATNPGDLVLDSFAGSGTTGHAVLKLNTGMAAKERIEHKEEDESENLLRSLRPFVANPPRRFILVEIEPKIARAVTAGDRLKRTQGAQRKRGIGKLFEFSAFFCGQSLPISRCLPRRRYLPALQRHPRRQERPGRQRVNPRHPRATPPFDGPKVIYCVGCLLGTDRLQAERITPRQTPSEIKAI